MSEILEKPIQVVILGSGGREHALAMKIAESPLCKKVFVLPGNVGMIAPFAKVQKIESIPWNKDEKTLVDLIQKLKIGLVVVGPDDLLFSGIVDALEKKDILVFGPRKAAAKLEWSKSFTKRLLKEAKIPTAKYFVVDNKQYLQALERIDTEIGAYPVVLKYDGLALGKGVRICKSKKEAQRFLQEIFEEKKFERSEVKQLPVVVIEEFLTGHEVSVFAICDGESYVLLDTACDYKRLGEGNSGPNTGGMGAYSPVPWLNSDLLSKISKTVFPATLAAMQRLNTPFKGLLYAGLIVKDEQFWVLEFNTRFGDPETQVLLPRLESDLLPLLYGAATSNLAQHLRFHPLLWSKRSCVNIVMASHGYPEKPEVGKVLKCNLSGNANLSGTYRLFFAGVSHGKENHELVTSGGRVLSISALGQGHEDARNQVLEIIKKISFDGMYYRKDIGHILQ